MNKTILILLLLSSVATATINLAYNECRTFILLGNESIEICAPAWVDLNITECLVCPPPSHVNLNLNWGQNASANNVTATCEAWRDTNLTICPPPTSPPPIVNMSLIWGQSATMNNFTANCQSWYDTNLTICGACSAFAETSYNLTYGENKTFNNFTANCAPWVDLNMTEPSINYTGCPQIDQTIDLYPDGIYSNFTYGLNVRCLRSLAQPTVVYLQQVLTPETISLNCNVTETRILNERNLTLGIQQCTVCQTCNVSELCPPRPDDQILNCSVKACFCQSELQDFVSTDAFAAGNARVAFNTSKNAYIAQASSAENISKKAGDDLAVCTDKYTKLASANEGNESVGWAIFGVVMVAGGIWWFKDREKKAVVNPRDVVNRKEEGG